MGKKENRKGKEDMMKGDNEIENVKWKAGKKENRAKETGNRCSSCFSCVAQQVNIALKSCT